MRTITLLVFLVLVNTVFAGNIYTVENPEPWNLPSSYTVMNLSSPGERVTIVGQGFGNRDNDSAPEAIFVRKPEGGYWHIYRGMYYNNGPKYFGILSWTDRKIELEVIQGLASNMGPVAIFRTYSSADDHVGTFTRYDLVQVIPEPKALAIMALGSLVILVRRRMA